MVLCCVNVAGFFFPDFPYVDNNCKYQVADLFAVEIDLTARKFIKAKMDCQNLTASETLILLWFNSISAQHVKLHSLANWGANFDDSIKDINPFLSMCNQFGYSSFLNFMKKWRKQGILSSNWYPNALISCFDHGVRKTVSQHRFMISSLIRGLSTSL